MATALPHNVKKALKVHRKRRKQSGEAKLDAARRMSERNHMAVDDHEFDDILKDARQKKGTESESAIYCEAILSKSSSQQKKESCECSGRLDATE